MKGDRLKAKDGVEFVLCSPPCQHGYYKPAGRFRKAKERIHRRDRRTARMKRLGEDTP